MLDNISYSHFQPKQMNKEYKPFELFQPLLTKSGLLRYGLTLQSRFANSHLSGAVHSYLQISAESAIHYPMIPDGTQAIFFSPQGSLIGGAQSQACAIHIPEAGEYFGIRFYPGALRHFFELDLADITDRFVDGKYLPCEIFTSLHERIYAQNTFQQRVKICEKWLLQKYELVPKSVFDDALTLIYETTGSQKINLLAKQVGCSARHLNRLFRYHTGLSTKMFSQSIRLQYACKQLHFKIGDSMSISSQLGFFDQAHFLNDFNQRLGANPAQFADRYMSDFYNS